MRGLATIGSLAAAGALLVSGCGGGDDEDIQAFCDKVKKLEAADDPFAGASSGDIDAAISALQEARDLMSEVNDVAPEEIQGEVEEAQSFFTEFVDAAQDAKSPQDFLAIATDFQDEAEDFEATSQRLEEYTNENCDDA